MSRTSVEFFALPNELRLWLQSLLSDETVWCVLCRPGKGEPVWPVGTREVKELDFAATHEDQLMLFVGYRDLAAVPLWRVSARGHKEIDFIRSRAIQIVPSLVVGDRILLEGRLAIVKENAYEEHGLDPGPLARWYRVVVESFLSMRLRDIVVVQRTTMGKLKEWTKIVITWGAKEWWSGGRLLKQFPLSPVEFELKEKGAGTNSVRRCDCTEV